MMKVISTQGLTFGEHRDENLSTAIKERVNPRLEYFCYQTTGEKIHSCVSLSFKVLDGEVKDIILSYTIDNPTMDRLSYFRDACDIFFSLHRFIADYDGKSVYLIARDIYDMGRLIQALDMLSVSLESVMCEIPASYVDTDDIYTPSGETIVQIPNTTKYRIKENTHWIAPNALKHCSKLRFLDIPCGMINHRDILNTYAPNVKYKEWETNYDGALPEYVEIDDDDDFILDEHHVAYSKDGKKLLFAKIEFCETRYEIPEGVEEIADFAFYATNTYVELVIPRSVHIIGDSLFGGGGHIIICK